jgi:hypothetical protein
MENDHRILRYEAVLVRKKIESFALNESFDVFSE